MDDAESTRRGVPLVVLAAMLATGAGATDIAAFSRLGGVFASVMTGNLTLLGLATSRASGVLVAHIGVALGGYLLGAAIGSRVGRHPAVEPALWPARVTGALRLELVPYAAFAAGWEITGSHPQGDATFALLGLAACAMGVQAAAMRHVGVSLSTTYLTGTLTGAIAALSRRGRPDRHTWLSVAVLCAHAAGAAAAGALILVTPLVLPLLPITAVAGTSVLAATGGVRP